MINKYLLAVKENIVSLSSLTQKMLNNCISALPQRNEQIPARILKKDSLLLLKLSGEGNNKCISALALTQPEAKDLRTVVSCIKMQRDYEHICDYIVDICQAVIYLVNHPHIGENEYVIRIKDTLIDMINQSIDSFLQKNNDTEHYDIYKNFFTKYTFVQEETDKYLQRLHDFTSKRTVQLESLLQQTTIFNSLKKIAESILNIQKEIIYIVTGKKINNKN